MSEMGKRIREARLASGLTQEQLAADDFSRSFVASLETGRSKPSAENLCILAKRLNRPLEFFLQDENAPDAKKVATLLHTIEALLQLEDNQRASELAAQVQADVLSLDDSALTAQYHSSLGKIELTRGNLIEGSNHALVASRLYQSLARYDDAWRCIYYVAHALYSSGMYDFAVEVAHKSLDVVQEREELHDLAKRSCYLLGSASFACGRFEAAERYFRLTDQFRHSGGWKMAVLALLGRSSCATVQGDWDNALQLAQQASALATERECGELELECAAQSAVSLVYLGDLNRSMSTITRVRTYDDSYRALKRKVYREYLLAVADLELTEPVAVVADLLRSEISKSDQRSWDSVKDSWALEKARLLHSESADEIACTVEAFARSFASLGRKHDESEVLSFGAKLLEKRGSVVPALGLMARAYALLK